MSTPNRAVGEAVVARVGDRAITTAELDHRIAAIRRGPLGPRLPEDGTPGGTRLRRWVAGLLASEALILHDCPSPTTTLNGGASRPAPTRSPNGAEPDTEEALGRAVRALFERVTAGITVSEAELLRYYQANPDLWERPERRTFRQAVRVTRAQAAAVTDADLGRPETITRGQLTGPLEDALFSVPAHGSDGASGAAAPAPASGTRIGPLRTRFGWHTAVLVRVDPAHTLPYRAVRDAIHADLLAAARGTAFDDYLAQRRADLVHLAPGYEHPGDPSLPDPVHRH